MNDDWNQIKWAWWTRPKREWKLACKGDRYGYIVNYAICIGIIGAVLVDHNHPIFGMILAITSGIVCVTAYFTRHE